MTCSARSCQAVTPPAVMTPSGSLARTRIAETSKSTDGYSLAKRPAYAQWPAHARPSTSPASASRREPVQTDAMSAPPPCIRRIQSASRANRP